MDGYSLYNYIQIHNIQITWENKKERKKNPRKLLCYLFKCQLTIQKRLQLLRHVPYF